MVDDVTKLHTVFTIVSYFTLFITVVEIELLLESENYSLSETEPQPLDKIYDLDTLADDLSVPAGSTSGGYAYQVLMAAAKELYSLTLTDINFKPVRFVIYHSVFQDLVFKNLVI